MADETPTAGASPAATVPELTTDTTPATSAAAPAPEQAKTDPSQPPADTQETGQNDKDDEQKQRRRRYQERIDQLTAQKRVAEARLAEMEVRYRTLLKEPDVPRDRELSYDEQENLRLRQVVRSERAEDVRSEAAQTAAQARQARLEMFQAKVESVADRMPDLAQKFSAVPVSEFAADFIAESERAAELAYYLGSNPHEAHRIASLPVPRQGVELARLESKLQAAPAVRKVSQAPNPPRIVDGGSAAPQAKSPSEMTEAEYSDWYRERKKKAEARR